MNRVIEMKTMQREREREKMRKIIHRVAARAVTHTSLITGVFEYGAVEWEPDFIAFVSVALASNTD